MTDEKLKVVPIGRQSSYEGVRLMLEEAAEALPPDTIAAVLVVQTRNGPSFPVFQGRSDVLLWMLEVAKFTLLLGPEDDDDKSA